MSTGTVKWFNDAKGFGFITPDDGVRTCLPTSRINMNGFKTLKEGQKVNFEVVQGRKASRHRTSPPDSRLGVRQARPRGSHVWRCN